MFLSFHKKNMSFCTSLQKTYKASAIVKKFFAVRSFEHVRDIQKQRERERERDYIQFSFLVKENSDSLLSKVKHKFAMSHSQQYKPRNKKQFCLLSALLTSYSVLKCITNDLCQ